MARARIATIWLPPTPRLALRCTVAPTAVPPDEALRRSVAAALAASRVALDHVLAGWLLHQLAGLVGADHLGVVLEPQVLVGFFGPVEAVNVYEHMTGASDWARSRSQTTFSGRL